MHVRAFNSPATNPSVDNDGRARRRAPRPPAPANGSARVVPPRQVKRDVG